MANRVEGVTEKLLECAMQEFLENGYNGASMRTIAENAGTTPRSIYTRYEDKEIWIHYDKKTIPSAPVKEQRGFCVVTVC